LVLLGLLDGGSSPANNFVVMTSSKPEELLSDEKRAVVGHRQLADSVLHQPEGRSPVNVDQRADVDDLNRIEAKTGLISLGPAENATDMEAAGDKKAPVTPSEHGSGENSTSK
jgi:hypothetical protein